MSKVRVNCFSVSLDGFGAGPNQDLENPLGVGGMLLHEWFFPTSSFQKMLGYDTGAVGLDEDFAARGGENIGAWILGRNMFGPVRGAWPDESWKGWWGDNPLARAKASAKGKDVRIGGGASTVRQYLQAGLVDEMHFAVSPVLLGAGEPLWTGLDLPALGFKVADFAPTKAAAHYVMVKRPGGELN